ncbi:hypothetical protein JDV02_007913 [Purpureocillium takamizusanense]|uniref:Uncharacterized protein n=1 Tax=Purpureocillium takamizusanense TaxID=2060973 RepID=A0A9Q8VDT1_9HYPO|nr:uncharacterized protein JDV02_007913 [Purpureocillium takamizusanense]UNI21978.1 hypothetical protein JDV02_007913 [Purpureocillium takamizusanense]
MRIATGTKMAGLSADQKKKLWPHLSYPPPGNNLHEQPPPVRQRQQPRHRDGLQPWYSTDTCISSLCSRREGVAGTRPTTPPPSKSCVLAMRLVFRPTKQPRCCTSCAMPPEGWMDAASALAPWARGTTMSVHDVVVAHEDAREPDVAPCNNLETGGKQHSSG